MIHDVKCYHKWFFLFVLFCFVFVSFVWFFFVYCFFTFYAKYLQVVQRPKLILGGDPDMRSIWDIF